MPCFVGAASRLVLIQPTTPQFYDEFCTVDVPPKADTQRWAWHGASVPDPDSGCLQPKAL